NRSTAPCPSGSVGGPPTPVLPLRQECRKRSFQLTEQGARPTIRCGRFGQGGFGYDGATDSRIATLGPTGEGSWPVPSLLRRGLRDEGAVGTGHRQRVS